MFRLSAPVRSFGVYFLFSIQPFLSCSVAPLQAADITKAEARNDPARVCNSIAGGCSPVQQRRPLLARGLSLVKRGHPFVKSGCSLLKRGTSLVKRGRSFVKRSGSFVKRGSTLFKRGHPFLKRGCSFFKSGPSLHERSGLCATGSPAVVTRRPPRKECSTCCE